jgi:signal transduction histidine kinase
VTRRIFAGFLAVLAVLLVAVVVPLGVRLSSQEREDFQRAAGSAARSLAAVEEEALGDRTGGRAAAATLHRLAERGDGVVLLDSLGQRIAAAGRPVSRFIVDGVRAGQSPRGTADSLVLATPVGDQAEPDGTVILVRDTERLDSRIHSLWLWLLAAAAMTVATGALVAAALARWIGRPLRGLGSVAVRMGDGDVAATADDRSGPAEVRAAATAFNDMSGRICSLLETQREMTADVSHQLRTPLAALRLRLELLAEETTGDMRAEILGALREIARLSRLADGLLLVARAEALVAAPVPLDVADIVTERVELWKPVADERGVVLEFGTRPAWASATPGHLEQILDNLLANALDATRDGHHVGVSADPGDGHVVLQVVDDGPGMDSHLREIAFDRFVGHQPNLRRSGLGLAIVGRLVAADHGTASLAETPGGGLSAVIHLPAAKAQRPRSRAVTVDAAGAAQRTGS